MITAYLVSLTLVVSAGSWRMLTGARWVYRSPGLGLAAWAAVMVAVVGAAAAAFGSLTVHWPAIWEVLCDYVRWCAEATIGGHGHVAHLLSWLIIAAVAVAACRGVIAAVRSARATRASRRRHASTIRLTGVADAALGAVVIDHPCPAAYVVPGRHGAIVVTSGAVDRLPSGQLAAVVAHERAHARRGHHHVVQAARLLTVAFPRAVVFAEAYAQIGRLVELHADDVATRRHSGVDLARALVTCAEAAGVTGPGPEGTFAVTGGSALERVRRLLSPPAPIGGVWRGLIAAASLLIAASPALLIGSAVLFPVLDAWPFPV